MLGGALAIVTGRPEADIDGFLAPLRLPLADLNEQLVGTSENLSANDPAALRTASERYAADALLAVQAEDGSEAYTRRGDLQVAASGVLTTGGVPDAQLVDKAMSHVVLPSILYREQRYKLPPVTK